MAENAEHKPFMAFSFDEYGVFDRNAGIYLHIPLEKPPTPEEIAVMVGTIKTFVKTYQELSGKVGLAEERSVRERLEEEPDAPPGGVNEQRMVVPRDVEGKGNATEAQCRKILAICHRLDGGVGEELFPKYAGAEWRIDKEGRCIPEWDFLQSLSKRQASDIIQRLERAEA